MRVSRRAERTGRVLQQPEIGTQILQVFSKDIHEPFSVIDRHHRFLTGGGVIHASATAERVIEEEQACETPRDAMVEGVLHHSARWPPSVNKCLNLIKKSGSRLVAINP